MENKDIQNILNEPDGEKLYETASEVKSAFAHRHIINVDVNEEWTKFQSKHQKSNWSSRFKAIAACSLLVIGIAIAAVAPKVFSNKSEEKQNETEVITNDDIDVLTQNNIFVFHDVALQDILNELSTFYGVKISCKNIDALQLRLYTQIDKGNTLQEALDVLNHFEKVHLKLDESNMIIVE